MSSMAKLFISEVHSGALLIDQTPNAAAVSLTAHGHLGLAGTEWKKGSRSV